METPQKAKKEMDIKTMEFVHNKDTQYETSLINLMGAERKQYNNETIYSKLLYNLCTNDTSNIDYNKYGKKGHTLKEISETYSDNIILAGIVPIQEITKQERDNNNNRFIKYYRNVIYTFLLKNNIKDVKPKDIKLTGIRKADGDTGHIRSFGKEEIKIFYTKFSIDVPENEQEIKAQHFKIALTNISYDTTLLLFNRKNILELNSNFVFVSDIDYTCDYAGSFNKQEIIDHLIENHNFRYQKNEKRDYRYK